MVRLPTSATPNAKPPTSPSSDAIAQGIALRIAAAGFFSVMSALLKLASTDQVSAPELVFYRGLFGLPVVLVWVLTSQGIHTLKTERPWAHVFRSALGITGIMLNFQALTMLSLADATTIGFTAPIFATLLSGLILKEAVGKHRWAAVLLGFLGVAVVLGFGPGGGHAPSLGGAGVALLGAFFTAAVTITLRQLKNTEHVAAIVFWFIVAQIVVAGQFLPAVGSWHGPTILALLSGGGVAGGLAQICMTASLRNAPVSVIAPFDYLQIVGAVVFGWWLLNSSPTLNTLAGGALIAASGLYTVWREHVRRRERLIQPISPPV
jgi:drug/metabolite transporter (DMT)-like permease